MRRQKILGIFAILAAFFTASCSVIKEVPVVHTEYVHTIDSVYVKDTTIQYRIEKEYVKEYAKHIKTLCLDCLQEPPKTRKN